MKFLFIFNDSPYGSQRTYNGLRLAAALSKNATVHIFLLGDGVTSALANLNPVHGDYNTPEMLRQVSARGVEIGVCRTCLEARGISDEMLMAEAKRSTMDELAVWTEEANQILTF